jgi:hypothetical protein
MFHVNRDTRRPANQERGAVALDSTIRQCTPLRRTYGTGMRPGTAGKEHQEGWRRSHDVSRET